MFVGRLDNLEMSYCAARALVDAFPDEASLQGEAAVKAVALFDHEEVGSSSAQGVCCCKTSSLRTTWVDMICDTRYVCLFWSRPRTH